MEPRWRVFDAGFLLPGEIVDLSYELAAEIVGFKYDGVKSFNLHMIQALSWSLAVLTSRSDWKIHASVDDQEYYCVWVERTPEHEAQRRFLMPRHYFDRYQEIMQTIPPSRERNERLEQIMNEMVSVFEIPVEHDSEWEENHQTVVSLYRVISDSRKTV